MPTENKNSIAKGHHGWALRAYIESRAVTVVDIAKALNSNRQTVYGRYGEIAFTPETIDALKRAGHKIPGIHTSGGPALEIVKEYEQKIEEQKDLIATLKKTITLLETLENLRTK